MKNHNKITNRRHNLSTSARYLDSDVHHGWPKFTQNIWYKTSDNSIAALVLCTKRNHRKGNGNIPVIIKRANKTFEFNKCTIFCLEKQYLFNIKKISKQDGMEVCYARVSTQEQNLDLQIDAFAKAGVRKVFMAPAAR